MIFGFFGGEKKRIAETIAAAREGDTEKVKQLLSKGVDSNASEPESGDTPLLAAIDKAQWGTAEFLLRMSTSTYRCFKKASFLLRIDIWAISQLNDSHA